ncbi:MAG TPA: hypothetical protein PKA95_16510, partial [Thermomicrobiales bacterium]|nr:hypothetical protein [Thermomicrobiales bacterium]
AFERTWARTDQPVADLAVDRTWMWGPAATTGALQEDYAEAPNGTRTVQYYDKARMEDNSWRANQAPWDVTNGLLVVELVTGQLQTGDTQFEDRAPAAVNIAGDPGEHPTYADIAAFGLRTQPATTPGTVLGAWVEASGLLASGPTPPATVTAAERLTVTGIDHTVASVFWAFMTSSGLVSENGQPLTAPLFLNPYYATGYPITEAYWSQVQIGGTPTAVLWQCFERRCLTYNPANSPGWQVEAGNVGQHYYAWRSSGSGNPEPNPTEPSPTEPPILTPTPDPGYKTFGDGVWIVGKDIEAGTYRSSSTNSVCYWERVSSFGGMLGDIIANNASFGRTVVTIDATDYGFRSEDCGAWSTDLSQITTSQTAGFGDGAWIVGVDIAPGAWRNSDSSESCYWERVSDFSGESDAIIANEFSTAIQTVTIAASDTGFMSSDCGTWTRIGD